MEAIIIPALATFRLAYLLVKEDGPTLGESQDSTGIFIELRETLKTVPVAGEALQCVYCFSLWASFPVTVLWLVGGPIGHAIVLALALSGGAILVFETIEALQSIGVKEDDIEDVEPIDNSPAS